MYYNFCKEISEPINSQVIHLLGKIIGSKSGFVKWDLVHSHLSNLSFVLNFFNFKFLLNISSTKLINFKYIEHQTCFSLIMIWVIAHFESYSSFTQLLNVNL